MPSTQYERDTAYLVSLGIFKGLHQKGVVSELELVNIASFLADRFSPSLIAKTPEIA